MARYIIKFLNGCISFVLYLALLSAGAYAGYCLWDNQQIDLAAAGMREEMLNFKPDISEREAGENASDFQALMAINPDVRAWLTLDDTRVDYPVLQGKTNIDYINIDAYGNFALAGSIFLDARSGRDFSDAYSVLYGHHMESGAMFGDLDCYKDEAFFAKHHAGTLVLSERVCSLRVFACMVVSASEKRIFTPFHGSAGIRELLDYAQANALHIDLDFMDELRLSLERGEEAQVVAFTTCSHEFADARTVVLAAMHEMDPLDREDVVS